MNNRMRLATYVASLASALVLLAIGLASPGYSRGQEVSQYASTPPAANFRWTPTGSLNTARWGHTATLLANSKVLAVGGLGFRCYVTSPTSSFCSSTVNSNVELYDPKTETWSYTGKVSRRAFHSATLLQNGEVLAAGGADWAHGSSKPEPLNSAELYDPTIGKWRPTGSFKTILGNNSATLLANGKVLAIGYSSQDADHDICSAELYDPVTGTWDPTGSPSFCGTTTLIPDSKVLNVSGSFAELYEPNTGTWRSTSALNVIRSTSTMTLLRNGKVLVTGWTGEGGGFGAELYDLNTETWNITGSPSEFGGIAGATATLLSDGRVLMAGGSISSCYDPDTGTWSFTGSLNTARYVHTATLLADGKLLVTGGFNDNFEGVGSFNSSAELCSPIAIPKITGAFVEGKKLFVTGEAFEVGAVILLNGEEQKTRNDDQNPRTTLTGKSAGKKLKTGDKLQVRNRNGLLSEEFTFTGSQNHTSVYTLHRFSNKGGTI